MPEKGALMLTEAAEAQAVGGAAVPFRQGQLGRGEEHAGAVVIDHRHRERLSHRLFQ